MKIWSDKEVLDLFNSVESCKAQNMALKRAFEIHAKKYRRKPNSVRNYYYHEVDNLASDDARRKRLNINLQSHEKSHFLEFKPQETKKLLADIQNLTKEGMSVRLACQRLSGGNLSEMTRLQNKFQNEKRKNFSNCALSRAKIKNKNVAFVGERPKSSIAVSGDAFAKSQVPKNFDNIIKFDRINEKTLSDSDINSLFFGLVKLIRKSAADEIFKEYQHKIQNLDMLLKKSLSELESKNVEILKLKSETENLKKENLKLLTKASNPSKLLQAHLSKKALQAQS